jgi:hypothetical protein
MVSRRGSIALYTVLPAVPVSRPVWVSDNGFTQPRRDAAGFVEAIGSVPHCGVWHVNRLAIVE